MRENKRKISFARKLRNNLTDTEKVLWYYIKSRQVQNLKFRRQAPIGPYIVDFVCYSIKLIIELDGSQHRDKENMVRDQKRDDWLRKQGFKILRFWDNEILENINGVMEEILTYCPNQNPPLTPPIKGRGIITHEGGEM